MLVRAPFLLCAAASALAASPSPTAPSTPDPAHARKYPLPLRPSADAPLPRGQRLYSQLELAHAPEARRQLAWSLQIAYEGLTFFDGFDFFNQSDPNYGNVNYVDRPTAFGEGLAFWTENGTAGIQAEHWAKLEPGTKRDSVRITSKALFAGGLFIIDLGLMPWGCGVWPAIWTLGYDDVWPTTGEIDIVEGIHNQANNQMTLHTMPGCTVSPDAKGFTGNLTTTDCDCSDGGYGCSIHSDSSQSFGQNFNAAGGGVYAMLWDGSGIRMWNFVRARIPNDIKSGSPRPANWGNPVAAFDASTCDPYQYFKQQMLILNVNLCGDWAGATYASTPECPGTCDERVADPANLVNTVMLINSIKVYQQSGLPAVVGHAATNENMTGAGGPVYPQPRPAKHIPSASQAQVVCLPLVLLAAMAAVSSAW